MCGFASHGACVEASPFDHMQAIGALSHDCIMYMLLQLLFFFSKSRHADVYECCEWLRFLGIKSTVGRAP